MFTHVAHDDYRVAKDGITGGGPDHDGTVDPSMSFHRSGICPGRPERARGGALGNGLSRRAIAGRRCVPRARTLSKRTGLMKAVVAADSDRILGFAMLGAQAGEVLAVVQMAMLGGLPYTALRDGILAHPTMAEGLNMLFGTPLSSHRNGRDMLAHRRPIACP